MRRLRRTGVLRGLTRETELTPAHLIQPLFVTAGSDVREEVESMPGVSRLSISELVEEAGAVHAAGVDSVLLFGIPADKDEVGSGAYDDEGIVQLAIRALKEAHPDLVVIADTCMCEYTSHGHCGYLGPDGEVDNDLSIELLAKTALSQAQAGADAIAPSDMMDGRIAAIRAQLDGEGHSERADHQSTPPSTPPPSTGRSATPPARPRRRATAAGTRWIRPTCSRRSASRRSTSTRAPTC